MEHGRCTVDLLSDIRTVAQTASTNADMLALASAGAREGLWLRAERQTAGRGRQGRAWLSAPGNLYASTLVRLRPDEPPAPTLALVAGVALAEAVAPLLRPGGWESGAAPLQLKWPNDLLLGGAKLSGVLLERADDAVVVGFGVNTADHPSLPDRATTSLAAHLVALTAAELLDALALSFAAWLARWRGTDGLAVVREAWLRRAHSEGEPLRVKLPDGSALSGTFLGLDTDGALRLRLADGSTRAIHAGDVFTI